MSASSMSRCPVGVASNVFTPDEDKLNLRSGPIFSHGVFTPRGFDWTGGTGKRLPFVPTVGYHPMATDCHSA